LLICLIENLNLATAIRKVGFGIVPDSTLRFPIHAQLIYSQSVEGITDEQLATLAATFRNTVGC
jgi:hypothetical protein